MEIWHNPRCSKSRAAKAALDEAGVDYTERRYLDQPPTTEEIEKVLEQLGVEPWEITRTGDAIAQEIGLRDLPRDAEHRGNWLTALTAHPALIQRPIVVASDGRALVVRDDETLESVSSWD
ncbi:ArsC/Spx/MgsR family protein [Nocardioides sp.]|uniref:ArsC/Spx/MgsR family protein n=1 Tax=Nocardioides sp. TaxID=35761 RepID=UPI0027367DC9|nr:ArsC/Spx/MgsR family protein [Nocardioides sp.]MDP3889699.1 ArsC/Spx/MgsR family protein [Nocardioides sp.]